MSEGSVVGSVSSEGAVGAVESSVAVEATLPTEVVTVTEVAPAVAVRKPRKAKSKVVVAAKPKKRGRGRPAVYVGAVLKSIVKLLRKHNTSKTRKILNATKKQAEFHALRVEAGLEDRLDVSLPTLGGIAAKHNIVRHRGRPVVKAAKKAKAA